jgi:ribosomal protein S12 methylthiotransferase accessory factor
VFHQDLAVSPNEVLAALARGHRVYGAASIGALRAVELGGYGMTGVGRVFDAYARGEIERDDEVAVSFDAETGKPLSEALVNIRLALREAFDAGFASADEAQMALAFASGLFYPLRSYRRVVEQLRLRPDRAKSLLDFLETRATNQKSQDARELLRLIATLSTHSNLQPRPLWPSAYRLPSRPPVTRAHSSLAQLPPGIKVNGWSSVRTVSPATTDSLLEPVRKQIGITRVADITGLDNINVPCYSAIWPGPSISAFSGKALDPLEARVGAQMEALENALSCDDRVPLRRARYFDLVPSTRAVDPDSLPVLASETRPLREVEVDWVEGWNLWTGDLAWVPADAVFFFRDSPTPPWLLTSNGLASGNCLVEALAHGLAEVIERDAVALETLETECRDLTGLLLLLAGPARSACPQQALPFGPNCFPFVDLSTLPEPLEAVVGQVRRAGADIGLRWVASDVGVPVFLAVIHQQAGTLRMVHSGAGAHPNIAVAARRAITEAAQSRATYIQGVREDLPCAALANHDGPRRGWFERSSPCVDFRTLPSYEFASVTDDLKFMARALSQAGLGEIFVVDVSHPEIPFSVVRVIVPGAEPSLNLPDLSRLALGWRARRVLAALSP